MEIYEVLRFYIGVSHAIARNTYAVPDDRNLPAGDILRRLRAASESAGGMEVRFPRRCCRSVFARAFTPMIAT